MGFKSRVNRAEWPNIDRENRVFTSPPITAAQNLIATCLLSYSSGLNDAQLHLVIRTFLEEYR